MALFSSDVPTTTVEAFQGNNNNDVRSEWRSITSSTILPKARVVSPSEILEISQQLMDEHSSLSSSSVPSTATPIDYIRHRPKNNPWVFSLRKRALWGSNIGKWICVQHEVSTCIAHVVLNNNTTIENDIDNVDSNNDNDKKASSSTSRRVSLSWRYQLWSIPTNEKELTQTIDNNQNTDNNNMINIPKMIQTLVYHTTKSAAKIIKEDCTTEVLLSNNDNKTNNSAELLKSIKISIGALDTDCIEPVSQAFTENSIFRNMKRDYVQPCGLYCYDFPCGDSAGGSTTATYNDKTDSDVQIRSLESQLDADLVNSKWEYKSATSLSMITSMMDSDDCCCLGVVESSNSNDVKLSCCAWILQYLDGPLGLLWCQEEYRQRGFATLLIQKAMDTLASKGETQTFAYIVDTNHASIRIFTKLGWERMGCANWVGFSSDGIVE